MNAVNTSAEDKKRIEELTETMIECAKEAKTEDRTVSYLITKYKYIQAAFEARQYQDIMIIDFPRPRNPILPEVETAALEEIEKWHREKDPAIKSLHYSKLLDICK